MNDRARKYRAPRPPASRPPAGAAVLQESVTAAIRRAAFEELARTGYASMAMEAVARRAGAGKAALYRRWPSKQAMVVELVSEVGVELADIPDTGSLQGDLRSLLSTTMAFLRRPLVARIVSDLNAEMVRNPKLARALRPALQERRREKAAEVLRRAMARGELPRDIDMELSLDFLGSPLYWRLLVTRQPTEPDYLDRLVAMSLAALGARA